LPSGWLIGGESPGMLITRLFRRAAPNQQKRRPSRVPLNGLSSPRAPLKTLTEVLPLVRSGSFME
jgi:hypothetical protein